MPTDPYVAPTWDESPRHAQNVAAGVHVPPARPWRATRPGDGLVAQPRGRLFGSPGPNMGYAMKLAHHCSDRFDLAPGEHRHDALAVVAEVAMKRAASFGRGPVIDDVRCAGVALGYLTPAAAEFVGHRVAAVAGAGHDYPRRRAICDAVPLDELRRPLSSVSTRAAEIQAAIVAGLAGSGERA